MALVTVMIYSYMLLFKMLRHGDHLYRFFRPCPDDLVMTAHTKIFYFLSLFFGQLGYYPAVLDMIGKRTMAKLTGNRLMDSLQMHLPNMGMTSQTGIIRPVADRTVHFFLNSLSSVMAEFTKRLWQHHGSHSNSHAHNSDQN